MRARVCASSATFSAKYPELPAKFHQLAWVKTVLLESIQPIGYLILSACSPKPTEQAVPSPFLIARIIVR